MGERVGRRRRGGGEGDQEKGGGETRGSVTKEKLDASGPEDRS